MIGSHDTENRLKTAPASKVHTTPPRAVEMYTLEGKHLKTFDSLTAAARYLREKGIVPTATKSNIRKCAIGQYSYAYGYKWIYKGN